MTEGVTPGGQALVCWRGRRPTLGGRMGVLVELFERVDALVDRDGLTAVLLALRKKVAVMVAAPQDRWSLDERERLKEAEGLLAEAVDELGGTDINAVATAP